MNQKTQFIIFFSGLVVIGLMVVGGVAYFKPQNESDGFLIDKAPTVQSPAVETIPAGSIINTNTSSSSPVLVPLPLPYYFNASTSNEAYWPKAWGGVSFTNTSLALIPDPTTHGANSFLNGASSWANYAVSANVSWLRGGWFDIVSRVADNTQDFVYCEFGPNGTEIIERVNGVDTQIASTVASAANTGAAENFGMKVYGNNIACTMANQEVVGVSVQSNEPPKGGIGFVIFDAPNDQKQVNVSDISVTVLSRDTIAAPFPVVVATPPVVISPPPPPVVAPPTPTPTSTPVTVNALSLPYSDGGSGGGSFIPGDGWSNWWGYSSEQNEELMIGGTASSTGGGSLLQGSSAWTDYTFHATVVWYTGETFGMVARYIDNNNYLVCEYDTKNVGDMNLQLKEYVNGVATTLVNGDFSAANGSGGNGSIVATAIRVAGNQASCAFNGDSISNTVAGPSIDPSLSNNGEIGFTTWDPANNNSLIAVKSVQVANGY